MRNTEKIICVFTPTYNRAYILSRLYESLCRQTSSAFEWLIVDDGSTDNTQNMISKWIEEGKISIRYFKQENGGKQRAHVFRPCEGFRFQFPLKARMKHRLPSSGEFRMRRFREAFQERMNQREKHQ